MPKLYKKEKYTMTDNVRKGRNILALITCLYFGLQLLDSYNKTVFLIWNVILAWLPLLFAIGFLKRNSSKVKIVKIIGYVEGFLWLIFYPNSIYVITDYIHLSGTKFYMRNPEYKANSGLPRVIYNYDFLNWNQFFSISVAVFLSTAVGFISVMLMYKRIKNRFNKKIGQFFFIIVNLLAGYAIYLGRFIRFNSWDLVTNPIKIVNYVISNLNLQAARFSICFGILSLIVCAMFYIAHFMIQEDGN